MSVIIGNFVVNIPANCPAPAFRNASTMFVLLNSSLAALYRVIFSNYTYWTILHAFLFYNYLLQFVWNIVSPAMVSLFLC